jgi:hypothetical protein
MSAYVRPVDLIATFEPDGAVLLRTARGVGARTPPFVVAVVAACTEPRTAAQIGQMLGPPAAAAFEQLVAMGLLVSPEHAHDGGVMFNNYTGVEVHRRMLSDEPRMTAFRDALKAVVRPGDVVIDAGSGTGAMAVYAALAGARKVYAIERTEMARVIPHVAAASGVGDIVQVLRGDFGAIETPEKANVIVSETIGHLGVAEGVMPYLERCAARNLLPGGVLIPRGISVYMAPMEPPTHPFVRRADGLDLSSLAADGRAKAVDQPVDAALVGKGQHIAHMPMPNDGTFEGELVLDEPCEAICGWFTLHMADGLDLPCGPRDPLTHWEQTILVTPLPAGTHRVVGDVAPEDPRNLLVRIGEHAVRVR